MDKIERINGHVYITLDGLTKPIGKWKSPSISYDQLRSRAWRYMDHVKNGKTPTQTVREIVTIPVLRKSGRQKKHAPIPPINRVNLGVSSLFCALTLGKGPWDALK